MFRYNKKLLKVISCGIFLQASVTSFNAEALDFMSDLVQTVGEVGKSVNDIGKATNQVINPNQVPNQTQKPVAAPVAKLAQVSSSSEIPKEFHGTWAKNCKSSNLEVEGIEVNKDGILGHEFHSEIKSARWIPNDRALSVTSSMCEGEDCQAPTPQTWILEKSDKSLTIAGYSGTTEYSRCSASTVLVPPATATSESKVLFSCKTKKGKEIKLINTGNSIEYAFGLVNQKPDILISNPYEKVLYASSLGSAKSSDYQVSIPNGNTFYVVYSYELHFSVCGKKCKSDFGHGVVVSKGGKKIADVQCDREAKPGIDSAHRMYDMEDNLYDISSVSDSLKPITDEDKSFKSRGFFYANE